MLKMFRKLKLYYNKVVAYTKIIINTVVVVPETRCNAKILPIYPSYLS